MASGYDFGHTLSDTFFKDIYRTTGREKLVHNAVSAQNFARAIDLIEQGKITHASLVAIARAKDFYPCVKQSVKSMKKLRKMLLKLDFPQTVEEHIVQFAWDEENILMAKKKFKERKNEKSVTT